MVIGYHLIWTAYGWWLPNDPRGNSSEKIRVERVADLGEIHYGRKEKQPPSKEIRKFYETAVDVLAHPLLTFDDEDVAIIASSFAKVIHDNKYTCYACAIMPDHVHLLVRRHRDYAEEMIKKFQELSRADLIEAGSRSKVHPVWGGPGWKVFLNEWEEMKCEERYVWNNPLKAGLPEQLWKFVKPLPG